MREVKVVYIDNSNKLELNKIYNALDLGDSYYTIYEYGYKYTFHKKNFKTLDKIRQEKIEKLI